MNYALIVDGIVENIIWLHPMSSGDFPAAVPTNDLPVQIGDVYIDGKFYRNGTEVVIPRTDEQSVIDSILAEVNA